MDYTAAWENVLKQSRFAWWEWNVRTNNVIYNELKATLLGEEISHGLCPACLRSLYPDIADIVSKEIA